MLAGSLRPTDGWVRTAEGARVVRVTQETAELERGLTAREVYERHVGRLNGAEPVPLAALGLLDAETARTPVGRMSQGQRRRLDLALALSSRPTLLLLDEPTNHLSARLVDELTDALLETSAAVVVATHDRQLLRDLAHWPLLRVGRPGTPT